MARSTKLKSIGTKRTASAGAISRSRARSRENYPRFAMCVDNEGNKASLDLKTVYQIIQPLAGDPAYMVRVIDNDGEDYLYYAKQFVPVIFSQRGGPVARSWKNLWNQQKEDGGSLGRSSWSIKMHAPKAALAMK
jgi:hypothetical protein